MNKKLTKYAKNYAGCAMFAACVLSFAVLVILKLFHHIEWSWWWVAAPLWAPVVITTAYITAMVIIITRQSKKLQGKLNDFDLRKTKRYASSG